MKFPRPLLLISVCALMAGCAETQKDASGFSGDERLDAMTRGTVLPGMTTDQVTRIWGAPQKKQKTGGGEDWIYYSGPVGSGYDVHTTVTFKQGKVDNILNGDLMAGRDRSHEPIPDVAPNMSRSSNVGGLYNGMSSPSFQALPGANY